MTLSWWVVEDAIDDYARAVVFNAPAAMADARDRLRTIIRAVAVRGYDYKSDDDYRRARPAADGLPRMLP